jgi:hypothetical protein
VETELLVVEEDGLEKLEGVHMAKGRPAGGGRTVLLDGANLAWGYEGLAHVKPTSTSSVCS